MQGVVKMLVLSSCSTRTLQFLYLIEGQAESLHIVRTAYVLRCHCYWGRETPIVFKHAAYQSEQHTFMDVVSQQLTSVSPTLCCLCLWIYSISVSSKRLWHKVILNSRYIKVTRKSCLVLHGMLINHFLF